MPLSAAHESLSNTILDQRNWPDDKTLTDDEVALRAQAFIEDLSDQHEQLRQDEQFHKGEIETLRTNLKVMHEERDEAEDALVEHVDSFRNMELCADMTKERRAHERVNEEQTAGQQGDMMEAGERGDGEHSVTMESGILLNSV